MGLLHLNFRLFQSYRHLSIAQASTTLQIISPYSRQISQPHPPPYTPSSHLLLTGKRHVRMHQVNLLILSSILFDSLCNKVLTLPITRDVSAIGSKSLGWLGLVFGSQWEESWKVPWVERERAERDVEMLKHSTQLTSTAVPDTAADPIRPLLLVNL